MYKKYLLFIVLLLQIWILTGCGQWMNASVGTEKVIENTNMQKTEPFYEITDIDRTIIPLEAVEIQMSEIGEPSLKITKGGNYILTGRNKNCNIVVNAYDDEVVHFFFKNVEISAENGPVILIEKAGKVIITVVEGTENTISDSSEYATETEACLFSSCDLTINGDGKLSVYGYYHDAIRSKDRLKIIGTNLSIKAKNDGLRGNDGVVVQDSIIELECEGTGIRAKDEQSYAILQGSTCKIIAGENAIVADKYVLIRECEYDLYSVLEAVKCNGVKEIEEGRKR